MAEEHPTGEVVVAHPPGEEAGGLHQAGEVEEVGFQHHRRSSGTEVQVQGEGQPGQAARRSRTSSCQEEQHQGERQGERQEQRQGQRVGRSRSRSRRKHYLRMPKVQSHSHPSHTSLVQRLHR